MNKKLWVGIYLGSFLIFAFTLVFAGLLLLLQTDRLISLDQGFAAVLSLLILAYVQFLVVSVICNFAILAKMWGPIQDGVNPVTVGKAIGLLFVPFFSIYWIFVAWGGFPKEYNNYLERHRLTAPGVTSGVFTVFPVVLLVTAFLLFPLLFIPFIFAVMISRVADAVNNLEIAKASAAQGIMPNPAAFVDPNSSHPERKAGIAIGLLAAGAVLLLIVGFINTHPRAGEADVPKEVGGYTREYVFTSGSWFFLRSEYDADYKSGNKSLSFKSEVYLTQGLAEKEVSSFNFDYCKPDDPTTRRGSVRDASGNVTGDISICDGGLRMRNGKVVLHLHLLGGSSAGKITQDELLQFALKLPSNKGVSFPDLVSAPSAPSGTSTTSTTSSASGSVDLSMTAEEFYNATNGPNIKSSVTDPKFKGKTVEISGRYYKLSDNSGERPTFHAGGYNTFSVTSSEQDKVKFAALKDDTRVRIRCSTETSFSVNLVNCGLIEDKGVVRVDDQPDVSLTSQEFYAQVQDTHLAQNTRLANQLKLGGKVIKVTGKVKQIGGKSTYLAAGADAWVTCYVDPEDENLFAALAEGQDTAFIGVADGSSLKHCLVAR